MTSRLVSALVLVAAYYSGAGVVRYILGSVAYREMEKDSRRFLSLFVGILNLVCLVFEAAVVTFGISMAQQLLPQMAAREIPQIFVLAALLKYPRIWLGIALVIIYVVAIRLIHKKMN